MQIHIFGATSAIAQACARLWATQTASFVLYARNQERLEIVKNDLIARGASTVDTVSCDFNNQTVLSAKITDLTKQSPDILFIAHGSLPDQEKCLTDFNYLLEQYNINCLSVFTIINKYIPIFQASGKGTLVTIGSVAGDRGRKSNFVYGSAKAALETYLSGVRSLLAASGVNVLTVKPGFVDTPMTVDIKKGLLFVSPDKVANDIIIAVQKKTEVLYTPWFWWPIMTIIKLIPTKIFKRLSI